MRRADAASQVCCACVHVCNEMLTMLQRMLAMLATPEHCGQRNSCNSCTQKRELDPLA